MLTIVSVIFIVLQALIANWLYNHHDDCLEPLKFKNQGIAMLICLTYIYTIIITEWRLEWLF